MSNLAPLYDMFDVAADDRPDALNVTEQAAEWLDRMDGEDITARDNDALADWLTRSPRHVTEFLRMRVIYQELRLLAQQGSLSKSDLSAQGEGKITPLYNLHSRRAGVEEQRLQRLWETTGKSPTTMRSHVVVGPSSVSPADLVASLYNRYQKKLSAMFRARGFSQCDAEDLLQETFARLIGIVSRGDAASVRNIDAYLYTMASHVAAKFKHHRVALPTADRELNAIEDPAASVEDRVDALTRAIALRRLLGRLPKRWREVIVRYYFREESKGEMCAALRLNERSLLRNLHNARRELVALIERTTG